MQRRSKQTKLLISTKKKENCDQSNKVSIVTRGFSHVTALAY